MRKVGVTLNLEKNSRSSRTSGNVVNSGEISTRIPSVLRQLSKVLYSCELLNQPNCPSQAEFAVGFSFIFPRLRRPLCKRLMTSSSYVEHLFHPSIVPCYLMEFKLS